MTRSATRTARRAFAVTAIAVSLGLVMCQDACVLASPSGDLPRMPDTRPTIVHSSLAPTTSAVLTTFPSSFVVPVELSDPNVTFVYAAFIDYNPLTGAGLVDIPQDSPPPTSTSPGRTGRIRTIEVNIPAPADLDACHRIEIVVALSLNRRDNKNAHTPEDPPGGDIATWWYNPNGDLGGCPSLDAGIVASVDAEAGEGGTR